jgi:hypothetical protein
LISIVYQFAEYVKQYAKIESANLGGGANSMKIKENSISEGLKNEDQSKQYIRRVRK